MVERKSILNSAYTKIVLGTILGSIGIASGIYVGFGLTGSSTATPTQQLQSQVQSTDLWMKVVPGDAFPLEDYYVADGDTGNFEQLLKDKGSIVVFTDWGCGPCLELLRFLDANGSSRVKPGTQFVLAANSVNRSMPLEYETLVKSHTVVFVNDRYWQATYHLPIWPTIIGVDESGIIKHIQFGYDGSIDHELVEEFWQPLR